MPKAIIFDLDGTLADTAPATKDALNETYKEFSFPIKTEVEVKAAIGNGTRLLLERTVPQFALEDKELFEKVHSRYLDNLEKRYLAIDKCYDNAIETLEMIRSMGINTALLSNRHDSLVNKFADKMFKGLFDKVTGQTDLPPKPSNTVPLMIAKEFGIEPSRFFFVGDSEVDVMTGKNSKMTTVGCSWGFRSRETLEKAGADIIIDSFVELAEIIKNDYRPDNS